MQEKSVYFSKLTLLPRCVAKLHKYTVLSQIQQILYHDFSTCHLVKCKPSALGALGLAQWPWKCSRTFYELALTAPV